MKKFNCSKFKAGEVDGSVFKGLWISSVGDMRGHLDDEGNQIKADLETLKKWELFLNSPDYPEVKFRRNHTDDCMATVGKFIKGTAKIIGERLVADLQLLPVAFTRAADYIGEYLQLMAKDAPEFVNLSVETNAELEPTTGGVVLKPVDLSAVALVDSGAFTDSLFAFAANKGESMINNNNGEITMTEEENKVDEVKPEAATVEEVKVEETKVEEKKEEVVAEETKVEETKAEVPEWAVSLNAMLSEVLELLKAKPAEAAAQPIAASKGKTITVLADDCGMPVQKVEVTKSEAEIIREARKAYKTKRI